MRMCKTFFFGGGGGGVWRTYICRYGVLADFDVCILDVNDHV